MEKEKQHRSSSNFSSPLAEKSSRSSYCATFSLIVNATVFLGCGGEAEEAALDIKFSAE